MISSLVHHNYQSIWLLWLLWWLFQLQVIVIDCSSTDILTSTLESGVENRVYPGAVAIVGNNKEVLYSQAVGKFSYEGGEFEDEMKVRFCFVYCVDSSDGYYF